MRLGFLVLVCLAGVAPAVADEAVRTGPAAYGDWRADAPGVRRRITPADLPPPLATRPAANLPAGQSAGRRASKAPPGFTVSPFANGLNKPRIVRVAPNGDLFVADSGRAQVRVFRAAEAAAARRGAVFAKACPVLRHRLLPARAKIRNGSMSRPATASCAFPIATAICRRPGSRDRRGGHAGRPSLDARHRLLARRQDAVRSVGSGATSPR